MSKPQSPEAGLDKISCHSILDSGQLDYNLIFSHVLLSRIKDSSCWVNPSGGMVFGPNSLETQIEDHFL